MNITWCLELNTDRPPLPYNEFDVLTLVFWVLCTTWLLVLSLVAIAKGHSQRFQGLDVFSLHAMNFGAWVQLTAVVISDGVLVGVSQTDFLRNLHCSLWDYWLEFALGFNVWFCALAYTATVVGLNRFQNDRFTHRHISGIALGVVAFFGIAVLALCLTAEFGGQATYQPEVDACTTKWPLKSLMLFYAGACLFYTAVFCTLVSTDRNYTSRMLVVPLRTVVSVGALALVLLLLVNVTKVTVYPLGRLLNAAALGALFVFANTTFYRQVLVDILYNHNASVVGLDVELRAMDGLDNDTLPLWRRDGFDAGVIHHLQQETRDLTLPVVAYEETDLITLCEMIASDLQLSPRFTLTDDDAPYAPSTFSERKTLICVNVAALAAILATAPDNELSSEEDLRPIISTHFGSRDSPLEHTLPLPAACRELLHGTVLAPEQARLIRESLLKITKLLLQKYWTLYQADQ